VTNCVACCWFRKSGVGVPGTSWVDCCGLRTPSAARPEELGGLLLARIELSARDELRLLLGRNVLSRLGVPAAALFRRRRGARQRCLRRLSVSLRLGRCPSVSLWPSLRPGPAGFGPAGFGPARSVSGPETGRSPVVGPGRTPDRIPGPGRIPGLAPAGPAAAAPGRNPRSRAAAGRPRAAGRAAARPRPRARPGPPGAGRRRSRIRVAKSRHSRAASPFVLSHPSGISVRGILRTLRGASDHRWRDRHRYIRITPHSSGARPGASGRDRALNAR
jgi:hypothetical protein